MHDRLKGNVFYAGYSPQHIIHSFLMNLDVLFVIVIRTKSLRNTSSQDIHI